MNSKENIKYITCGIQFNHSFKILDYWGEIVDQLLYKSKYFNVDVFDNISSQYTTDRTLTNSKNGDYLKLTSNQLIFKSSINSDFVQEFNTFKKRISEYLVPEILSKYNLVNRRIGLVICNRLNDEDLDKFTAKYFKPEINNITAFRFSKKELAKEALLWKATNNYINKIFTVGNVNEEMELGVVYDFQLYFDPVQAEIRHKVNLFLDEALKNFRKDVIEVIN